MASSQEKLVQQKQLLTSSQARAIHRDIKRGSTTLDASKKQMDFKDWIAVRELLARDNRPDLLVEIANLHDDGYQRTSTGWLGRFYALPKQNLLNLRDELRHVWRGGGRSSRFLFSWLTLSLPSDKDKDVTIKELEDFFGRPFGLTQEYAPIAPSLALGCFIVDSRNLPAQLVQAVLEHRERMKICANPECTVPYFLAKRRTQKYCEAGVCVNYAARQYKLKYWHKTHGDNAPKPKMETKPMKKTGAKRHGRQRSTKRK